MIEPISLFFITFAQVFFRAFQQKNVIHNKFAWVTPLSFGMATCEILIITVIVASEAPILWSIIGMGSGGGIGCMLAMLLHNKLRKRDGN